MEERSNVYFVGNLFNWRNHAEEVFRIWQQYGPDEVINSFIAAGMQPAVAKAILKRVIGAKFGGNK